MKPGNKHADLYLNERNKRLRVLPSFIFPFANKILLDMSLLNPSWMSFYNTLHGEQYIEQFKQLPPEGVINLEIKTVDILDKGKGTLLCYNSR